MNKRPSALSRLSPRDWSLRVKLLVVLLVPGVLAAVLGGLRIADQTGEAAALDRVTAFATAQGEVATLVEGVALERYAATAFVAGGRTGDRGALDAAFAQVDATQEAVRPVVAELEAGDPTLGGAVSQFAQAQARLPALRNLVLTSNAPASAVISRYSELVDQLVALDGTLLQRVNTTEVNGLATALSGLSSARNEASLQYALVTAASAGGEPASADLVSSDARLRTGLADFRAALDPAQRVRFAGLVAGPANTARGALVQGGPGATADTSAVFDAVLAEMDDTEAGLRDELAATSAAREAAASSLAGINAVALLLALLAGALIVGLIARVMITSLRTLRRSALEVADRQLPEAVQAMRDGAMPDVDVDPVPVTSREEVGEVARAFDAVHLQAVRLAAEQATLQNNVNRMFVNLSRRSQTLVDKQLQLIEELEKGEQDPDQLSNLFRLDHLATRMRRNSENLLVLAGTDLAKRSTQHVPVVDVLRAAVSEVDQYERVTVASTPAAAVVGRAANDVQHLLSELLDNATSFSPPDSQVRMSCIRIANGQLIVEITDDGVGMPPGELAETNRRLGLRTEAGVTTARRMGLFVVGRLASRHGIDVRLVTGPGLTQARVQRGGVPVTLNNESGLTARVTVPAHLVVALERPPLPVRTPQPSPHPVRPDLPPQGGPRQAVPGSIPPRGPGAPDAPGPMFPPRPGSAPRPAPAPFAPVASTPVADVTVDGPPAGAPWAATEGGTPIFEEVTSGWFRPYRAVPITWADGQTPDADVPAPRGGAAAEPAVDSAVDPASFASAADAGWTAAGIPAAPVSPPEDRPVDAPDGLPRRTPGARLLPGGVPVPPVRRTRDAEAVRGRLAGYQRGVREGRGEAADVPVEAASGGGESTD